MVDGIRGLVGVGLLVMVCGCGSPAEPGTGAVVAPPAAPGASLDRAPSNPVPSSAPLVLFLGDSLSAGYGLGAEQAFPALVGERLGQRGVVVRVVNAGVSGDTTAGGLARIDWLLRQKPALVVVELGANDGLRGLPLEESERNLRQIIERSRAAGARVLLAGMKIPPNYGADYTRDFEAIYPRLARELGVGLIPFLLEGVAAEPDLNQADGIHPTAKGHEIVAETVAGFVETALR